jgi:hypothetical protein
MEDTYILEGKRTIKMTYGLIQNLANYFKNLEQVENMSIDTSLQNILINEVLAERDENGQRTEPLKNYALDLSIAEGEKLMEWIMGHVLDFFISQLRAQTKAVERMKPLMEEIKKTVEEVQKANTASKPA